jgi:oxygen-independent coproporphyrinogen-3 oxidase
MRMADASTGGIYVHIPFCESKCAYCAFNSRPTPAGVPAEYVSALLLDIAAESEAWTGIRFKSVYLGGGTPSLLSPRQLGSIMNSLASCFEIDEDAEVTIECNPGSLDLARARAFRDLGVNRVSVGVQSMCEAELASLGRRHNMPDSLAALEALRSAGFENVSADVMLGIPGQCMESLHATLEQLSGLVDHVSAYLLSVEPGTDFERMAGLGDLDLPSESKVLELYGQADRELRASGFSRYEVSNWSRPASRCVHNLMYWGRGDYAGLGAGAHSHRGGLRYSKVTDPEEYIARLYRLIDPVDMRERLTQDQILLEEIMLGLRTERGLDLAGLKDRFVIDECRLDAGIAGLIEQGLLSRNGNNLQLSPNGIKVCDSVTENVMISVLSR